MTYAAHTSAVAFAGDTMIAFGPLREVAASIRTYQDRPDAKPVLVFDADTSQPIDLDLRGSVADVVARLPQAEVRLPRKAGRPKLGVAAREVTLLPRHWDWLAQQPGGASVTLRKLVEAARRSSQSSQTQRVGRESLYRFMSAMVGNAAGFEEASRALFADDAVRFAALSADWPSDVLAHVTQLSQRAFAPPDATGDAD